MQDLALSAAGATLPQILGNPKMPKFFGRATSYLQLVSVIVGVFVVCVIGVRNL
jgi:hypothetical protein